MRHASPPTWLRKRHGCLDTMRCIGICRSRHQFFDDHMPLVRTPMIAPTKLYDHVPTLSPEDAANLIADAIVPGTSKYVSRPASVSSASSPCDNAACRTDRHEHQFPHVPRFRSCRAQEDSWPARVAECRPDCPSHRSCGHPLLTGLTRVSY